MDSDSLEEFSSSSALATAEVSQATQGYEEQKIMGKVKHSLKWLLSKDKALLVSLSALGRHALPQVLSDRLSRSSQWIQLS